ncbi:hypothetical protein RI138_31740 [Streptomyces sp. C11-1]|uniref:Uncharacterized protein n=1 Tax=Streptomyces durocortorensis TaxID=2811104 RepID=A0ABY9W4F2_9ACTN|nr:hypothetical protein [Streptomyces durocortorensis]WNF31039.1 hypothetical protein RI138_31740 [Streptomyces durocortorensis]
MDPVSRIRFLDAPGGNCGSACASWRTAGPQLRPHLSYLEQLGREPGGQWLLVVATSW